MFLRSQRRLRESAEQLVAAAQLTPADSARAASAARALRDARRCRSAERWYARAVQLNPDVSYLKYKINVLGQAGMVRLRTRDTGVYTLSDLKSKLRIRSTLA